MWMSRSERAFRTPGEIVAAFHQGVEVLFDPARYLAGFHSGLDALDRLAGGLRRGTLTLLGGEAGVGKTTLALAYVRNAALVNGAPTAITSPAVTSEQLLLRLIAAESCVPLEQFTKHGLDATERTRVLATWQQVSCSPLFINDIATNDPCGIRRSLRALLQRTEVQFAVVDAVGVEPTPGWFRRSVGVAEFYAGIAREFHVALLALARRLPADGEQHADRIIDLRRMGPSDEAEAWVHRNRFGPTGQVNLSFNADWLAFQDPFESGC